LHEDSGLRERGKARRRDAIIRAGLKLFAERGYDATTIADIAAEADVAPRTVTMYFPSKQDIAMARFGAMADSLTSALCGRAPGESVPEVVGRWLRTEGQCADRDLRELGQRMFAANPELNALRNTLMAEPIAKGADLLAKDTGAAPGDPGPRIAAVTAAAVVLQLSEIPPGPQKDEAITAAMRFLDAGIATLGPGSTTGQ
jgi:AcrR family transcriptional regulator